MAPPLDIVIRAFHRDRHWLALCLRSIAAFATGYRQVVVVVPRSSLDRMDASAVESKDVRLRVCPDYPDDYLGQQVTKLHADRYTDAELILHLDSDNVFVAPCDLKDRLLDGGRPRMAFSNDGTRPASDGWRQCPTLFLGEPVGPDLTAPPPLIVPRHVYAGVRAFSQDVHGTSITAYAFAAGVRRFCEFALLRGYALAREPDRYVWVEAGRQPLIPECRHFWSRAQTPVSVAGGLPSELADCADSRRSAGGR